MRGRLLLGGLRLDDLDLTETIALAEACLFEPVLHGSMTSVDEVLDKWEAAIAEAWLDTDTWGTSKIAAEGLAAAEAAFPAAAPRDAPPAEPILDE